MFWTKYAAVAVGSMTITSSNPFHAPFKVSIVFEEEVKTRKKRRIKIAPDYEYFRDTIENNFDNAKWLVGGPLPRNAEIVPFNR